MPRFLASARRTWVLACLMIMVAHVIVERHDFVDAESAAIAGVVALVAALAVIELFAGHIFGPAAPSSMSCSSAGVYSVLQLRQIFRTSRWATMPSSVAVTRNGSRPRSSRRAMALGASLVCSVLKTRWPVREACTAISAVSLSRISPTRIDVRVLTQHGSQDSAEGQFDVRLDLALNDAVDVVFDRVFGGDQLAAGIVQFAQRGIERGGFSRAGGAGDDDDAVGLVDQLADGAQVVVAHADLVQIELHVGSIEHAHDDAFAEHGRQHGDAQVDRLVVDVQLDAAVLRHAALGDVEIRHDLDARS